MCSRCRGSMPLNGSSSSRIRGSWTSAPASLARWRMPLEYVPIGRSAASVRSTVAMARAAAASGSATPWSRALSRANSQPGQEAWTASRSGTRPTWRYISGRRQASAPSTRTRPADGARSPAMRWSSVDLPAPFGPSRPVTPGPRPNEMSLTATTLPYQRETWSTSRAGRRDGARPREPTAAGSGCRHVAIRR